MSRYMIECSAPSHDWIPAEGRAMADVLVNASDEDLAILLQLPLISYATRDLAVEHVSTIRAAANGMGGRGWTFRVRRYEECR